MTFNAKIANPGLSARRGGLMPGAPRWTGARGARALGEARPPAWALLLPGQRLPVTGQPSPGLAVHQP